MHILIRCDASDLIGSGHVIRCCTLARVLVRRKATIHFICRQQSGDLISLIETEFPVIRLPQVSYCTQTGRSYRSTNSSEYEAWLGCSQLADATDTIHALKHEGITHFNWLIVDHYGLDSAWQSVVKSEFFVNTDSHPLKLLAIDDLANRPHNCDILLDQNFFGYDTHDRYEGLVNTSALLLLGPHYALLGPEYSCLHRVLDNRNGIFRIFVFFGADPDNLTALVLQALMHADYQSLAVDVVLGFNSPHLKTIQDIVESRPNFFLHVNLPSLSGLIARADIGIGAGGTNTWERICLKLPTLVFASAQNQLLSSRALDLIGLIRLFPSHLDINPSTIKSFLDKFLAHLPSLSSTNYITDGLGAERLCSAILGYDDLHFHSFCSFDRPLLQYWYDQSTLSSYPISSQHRNHLLSDFSHISDDFSHNTFIISSINPTRVPVGFLTISRVYSGRIVDIFCHLDSPPQCNEFPLKIVLYVFRHSSIHSCNCFVSALRMFGPECSSIKPTFESSSADISFSIHPKNSSQLAPSFVSILIDSSSWLIHYLLPLFRGLWQRGHVIRLVHHPRDLVTGDVCIILSCSHILSPQCLQLHRHNLVVHESNLPHGRGWSPMSWQIIEHSNEIPVTLFEASSSLDSGRIYLQQVIHLDGTELIDEWRQIQASTTVAICFEWFDSYQSVVSSSFEQIGTPTFFPKRTPLDSELDPNKSLAEQFDLLRSVDNDRYPAFFSIRERLYKVYIDI